MLNKMKDAMDLYNELLHVSRYVLGALQLSNIPTRPVDRTRPWRYGFPRGVLYHYTGGADGLKSMRWFNNPRWGNTVSSCHVIILDRIPKDSVIGKIWMKLDPAFLFIFPAPTIILCPWTTGTWHGNWSNNMTLGVECRNVGRIGKAPHDGTFMDKPIVMTPNGRFALESYSRDQIVSCINIGRLCQGWCPTGLDMDWVLTHQCVWATKRDAGPAFPLQMIRGMLADPARKIPGYIEGCPASVPDEYQGNGWEDLGTELREEPQESFVKWETPVPGLKEEQRDEVIPYLLRIGYNVVEHRPESFDKAVRWYQRSTGAYGKLRNGKGRVLKPDGVCGKLTIASLKHRMVELDYA